MEDDAEEEPETEAVQKQQTKKMVATVTAEPVVRLRTKTSIESLDAASRDGAGLVTPVKQVVKTQTTPSPSPAVFPVYIFGIFTVLACFF